MPFPSGIIRSILKAGLRVAVALFALTIQAHGAPAQCKLGRLAQLPVTMYGMKPMIPAKINGTEALFVVDSGAFYSLITPATALQFKLPSKPAPFGAVIYGVGGQARVSLSVVDEFSIAGITIPHLEFIVTANEFGGAAGLLGQNVLRAADVDYDLANGVINLVGATDCRHAELAYWAGSIPYSSIDISGNGRFPHTIGHAYVNGTEITVIFDTGASTSILALRAAGHAGVTPSSPGVSTPDTTYGIGRHFVKTWIAPFASFKIGDEEVRNTRLRIGDIDLPNADMLLGADFFLSHHIYVANSQHKLYFTYNGGPVFNLNSTPKVLPEAPAAEAAAKPADASAPPAASASEAARADARSSPASPATAPSASAATAPSPPSPASTLPSSNDLTSSSAGQPPAAPLNGFDNSLDAAGFSRRGEAHAARHEYQQALFDLNRAIELDPKEAAYYRQRAQIQLHDKQLQFAKIDIDQALKLQPDDVSSLVLRARCV